MLIVSLCFIIMSYNGDIGAPSMYTSVNLDIMQYICGFCGVETYHVFFEQALGRHLSFLLGQFKPTKDDKWSVEY